MPGRGPTSESPTPPELGDYLGGIEFAVSRDDLIAHVAGAGAPEDVRQTIDALEAQDFDSLSALYEAVAGLSR